MNSQALVEAQRILSLSKEEGKKDYSVEYNPIMEAELALSDFLKSRLFDLKKDAAFKDSIIEVINARLPEFKPRELIDLVSTVMANTTIGTDHIMAPFLESRRTMMAANKDNSVEEEIFVKSSKDMLESFNELFTLVEGLKRVKDDDSGLSIKEALAATVEVETIDTN